MYVHVSVGMAYTRACPDSSAPMCPNHLNAPVLDLITARRARGAFAVTRESNRAARVADDGRQ